MKVDDKGLDLLYKLSYTLRVVGLISREQEYDMDYISDEYWTYAVEK